jgi:hypothetical protein
VNVAGGALVEIDDSSQPLLAVNVDAALQKHSSLDVEANVSLNGTSLMELDGSSQPLLELNVAAALEKNSTIDVDANVNVTGAGVMEIAADIEVMGPVVNVDVNVVGGTVVDVIVDVEVNSSGKVVDVDIELVVVGDEPAMGGDPRRPAAVIGNSKTPAGSGALTAPPASATDPGTAETPPTAPDAVTPETAETARNNEATATRTGTPISDRLAKMGSAEAASVGYAAATLRKQEIAIVARGAEGAAAEEAFRLEELPIEFAPESTGLLLDPSGLAAAELALQQVLSTLSDLTWALLDWFAMVGPTPFILASLAAIATMSEVARRRVQRIRDMHRYASDW